MRHWHWGIVRIEISLLLLLCHESGLSLLLANMVICVLRGRGHPSPPHFTLPFHPTQLTSSTHITVNNTFQFPVWTVILRPPHTAPHTASHA